MIAKLEWTQSNAQQNIEQLQNPTMGVTINNESTTTEPPSITVCSFGILLNLYDGASYSDSVTSLTFIDGLAADACLRLGPI